MKPQCQVCFKATPDAVALPDEWQVVCDPCALFVAQITALIARFVTGMLAGRMGDEPGPACPANGDETPRP